MKRTITVLVDDIANGKRNSAYGCAISLAARRDLADLVDGNPLFTSVRTLFLYDRPASVSGLVCEPAALTGILPPEAARFVRHFDNGLAVEPFKFEIELRESQ